MISINNKSKIIDINNISLFYQTKETEVEAIRNISFSVSGGEFVGIVGPSGCGKSTLLSLIAGLLRPSSGSITIYGKNTVGYMLQKDYLFPWRTIHQNILLGLEIKKAKTKENIEKAENLLKTYGLWDFRNSFPDEISGGMRQRCALIRTLAVDPSILLLDEAFSALDYQTRLAVADDIYSIIKREKKTVLMVTHDISEALSLCDRIIVLSSRPAVIKSEYNIDFGEELTPIDKRDRTEFPHYFNSIWRDIDVKV